MRVTAGAALEEEGASGCVLSLEVHEWRVRSPGGNVSRTGGPSPRPASAAACGNERETERQSERHTETQRKQLSHMQCWLWRVSDV